MGMKCEQRRENHHGKPSTVGSKLTEHGCDCAANNKGGQVMKAVNTKWGSESQLPQKANAFDDVIRFILNMVDVLNAVLGLIMNFFGVFGGEEG